MLTKIKNFFFPPTGASRFQRVLPYAVLGVVTLSLLVSGAYGWEYTNSPEFCGATCHTMPPEYAAYQVSPHARVACVECHIGRGFIATRITRKAGDIRHVTATLFHQYEFPIYADRLRPARETCEQCHFPEKFSDDSLREKVRYLDDEDNTAISIYLAMRTGGGSEREGLGRGIHWHVENEVYFVALDDLQQEIPYVRVVWTDGTEDEYFSLDSPLSAQELAGMEQVKMDCITCHNRISHSILPPERAVDQALSRSLIDADIPFIREKAVDVLSNSYETNDEAHQAIRTLEDVYADEFPEYTAENRETIQAAVEELIAIYDDMNFLEQEVTWETHPNNLGHSEWPGCFRCHDGQHVNAEEEAIRLECNLCHSIPQVVEPGVLEPTLPLATGIQPESHFSTHWIALHRESVDQSCQACHTVGNAGGTDNSSFCSNSACHGSAWNYAGLDAPGLAELLADELPEPAEAGGGSEGSGIPTKDPTPVAEPSASGEEEAPAEASGEEAGADLTFSGQIGTLFQERCTACHNATSATGGLILETYQDLLAGGKDGPVIVPGDAEASPLVLIQRGQHFGQFTDKELDLIIEWIIAGAPE